MTANGRTSDTAYEGEADVDFKIVYTAPGPMYGSSLRVTLPTSLVGTNAADNLTFGALIQYSQSGGVNFRNTNPIEADFSDRTITLHIDKMRSGNRINIFYDDIDVIGTPASRLRRSKWGRRPAAVPPITT